MVKFEMKAVEGMTMVKTTSEATEFGFFMMALTTVRAYLLGLISNETEGLNCDIFKAST